MGLFDEMKAKNHWDRLGIQRTADAGAVKRAYLLAARKYHPDVHGQNLTPEALKERTDVFALIVEASTTLSDDAKRAAYLSEVEHGSPVDVQKYKAAEQAFNKGKIQLQGRNYEAALKLFTEATSLDPADAEALAWRGYTTYLSTPHKAKGLEDINKALAMNPAVAAAYYFLGFIFKAQGDKPKALLNFKKCVALDPRHIDAMREVRMAR